MKIEITQNPNTINSALKAIGINQTLAKELAQLSQNNSDSFSFINKQAIPPNTVSPALTCSKSHKVFKKILIKYKIYNIMHSVINQQHYGFIVRWSNGELDTIEVPKKDYLNNRVNLQQAFNYALFHAMENIPNGGKLSFMQEDIIEERVENNKLM